MAASRRNRADSAGALNARMDRLVSGDAMDVEVMPMAHESLARSALSPPPGTESMDFDLHESKQYVDYVSGMAKKHRKSKGGMRWLLIICTGVMTGVVAVIIDIMVKLFFTWRSGAIEDLRRAGYPVILQYVAHVAMCVGLATVPGILVCFVEPLAAGSGIPEVKCYLNGVNLPRVTALKTLLAKAPGVMFSVAAGLPCGKEGPMIHSGAIIGSVLANLGTGPMLRPFRVALETRDFVAAGASAGVAAAFGAPVGGVLFAVEEGATHMNAVIMMRTFVSATFSCLTAHFFLPRTDRTCNENDPDCDDLPDFHYGDLGNAAPLSFGFFPRQVYHIWELSFWAALGILGGLCGALFNAANTRLTHWRMRHIGGRGVRRFLEVLVVTTFVSSLFFLTPPVVGEHGTRFHNFTETEALFWQSGESSIRALFHNKERFDPGLLSFFAASYYVLACWTYGLGVPSGLFVPSLLSGAAIGRLFGQLLHVHNVTQTPQGIYALMGATAFLSGMARITISLAVILMEATGSTVWAIPIFITVMASKWTGDLFNKGLYDIHIGLKHVPLLETFPEKEMIIMRARDVMNKDVLAVERVETVDALVKILHSCSHNAFPVVHYKHKHYIGMVKRSTLHEVLYFAKKHGVFHKAGEQPATEVPIIPYEEIMGLFPKYPSLEEIENLLDADDYNHRIDLQPYMNRGGFTVPEYAALTRVYMLFRNMGLRHLPVVSPEGDVAGIITRKDLIFVHQEIERGHEINARDSFAQNSVVEEPATLTTPTATYNVTRRQSTGGTVSRRQSLLTSNISVDLAEAISSTLPRSSSPLLANISQAAAGAARSVPGTSENLPPRTESQLSAMSSDSDHDIWG